MEYEVQTVLGPKTASVSKSDALVGLIEAKEYPQGALLETFEERNGQWVAKLRVPKEAETKVAAPPPFAAPGPDDAPPTPPSDPSEGPPKDEGESSDPNSEKPDEKSDDGPPKPDGEGKEPKKPSVEEAVLALTDLVTQIADKLGIGGPDSPMGNEVGGPPAPPVAGPPGGPGGHAGPGRPPQGPGGQSAMMRARPLKPGEAPNSPGVTPVGAPAFASVQQDHPWKPMLGKVPSFSVSNATDASIAEAIGELHELAKTAGLSESAVKQVREGKNESGERVVRALINTR